MEGSLFLNKISRLLFLFDPLGKVFTCEFISLRCFKKVAVEKVILDIFVKTHHHMLEEKLNHWQAPYNSVSSLIYFALDVFISLV